MMGGSKHRSPRENQSVTQASYSHTVIGDTQTKKGHMTQAAHVSQWSLTKEALLHTENSHRKANSCETQVVFHAKRLCSLELTLAEENHCYNKWIARRRVSILAL